MIAIISTFIIILILYLRKIYNDKKDSNSLTESSTNILQLQIDDKKIDSENCWKNKKLKLFKFKTFSSGLEKTI